VYEKYGINPKNYKRVQIKFTIMKTTNELRDELAMKMPKEALPTLNAQETMEKVAKEFDIDVDFNDEISLIEFSLKYQAAIRYKYADAMIEARAK